MTNCRAPPKKVQAEPLASRGDISSNPRKQYANGEAGEREEPMLRNQLPPTDRGGGEFSTEADERPWDSSRGGTGRYVHATPLFNREKLMGHLDGDEVDSME